MRQNVQDATQSRDCRTQGCAGVAKRSRGHHAGLCGKCEAEAIAAERAGTALLGETSFEGRVRALLPHASRLDAVLAKPKASVDELREAVLTFHLGVKGLSAPYVPKEGSGGGSQRRRRRTPRLGRV